VQPSSRRMFWTCPSAVSCRDAEPLGDLLVRQALHHSRRDAQFAMSETSRHTLSLPGRSEQELGAGFQAIE
jgi:hypothetical protein